MDRKLAAAMIATGFVCAASTLAIAQEWKDGMLFTEEELASLEGHNAVKIVFGLEPGKCAGEFTAPDEWLKMTEGTLTFTYPDKGDVEHSDGDSWLQAAGTKVTVCNKGDQNAVLVGVQLRAE